MLHFVVGTKAQLIKIAPIMASLQQRHIEYNFIFTGQHKDTIDKLIQNFNIKQPDIILYNGKDVTSIIQMLFWMIRIIFITLVYKKYIFCKQGKNDIVLVHGDTFSTLLGALMGRLSGKKVAHIESGLRSFNVFHPFPEEIIRILTHALSDLFFCPGEWAMRNINNSHGMKIDTSFNTLYDSLSIAREQIDKISIEVPKYKYAIISIHRFENIFNRDRLCAILDCLNLISEKIKLLFVLHPPTWSQLCKYNLISKIKYQKNIQLCNRYDYFDFIKLLINSEFLITDGGSNQEEAYYLGKPTLLMRKTTERQDGINRNVVISNYNISLIMEFVTNYKIYLKNDTRVNTSPSSLIISHLKHYF